MLLTVFLCVLANAQTNAPPDVDYGTATYQLSVKNLSLQLLLESYSSILGAETEIAPGVNNIFTFASDQKLTRDEAIEFITSELAKERIHLVKQENGTLRAEWIP